MERLTFDGLFCDIAKCDSTPGGTFCESGTCTQRRVWEQLKEYEDTGLGPEEIKKHEMAYNECLTRTYGPFKQKISQWIQAEQDGRLVVLPCKVGGTVYVIGESCDFCETYLDEPERCMRCQKGNYVEERGFELWMLSELNESIFLTREEADAALALKGGEG